MKLARGVICNALDGQRYAQVNQPVAIALPTDKTKPLLLRSEHHNGRWGDRYLISPALEEFLG